MRLWIDGEAADVAALAVPALVNYGHFTAMQIRHGAVRGLANHLRRVDAAHRELFGHGPELELVRARLTDVPAFDGAFTVNSVGVVPVAQIDGHRFPEPSATVAAVITAHVELPWDPL